MKKIGIIGGGAAGYFLAANLGKKLGVETVLWEQSSQPLQKVSISGGGRCNVTHACFDPKELVQFYPRGNKELRSVFHKFQPGDTMAWFESRDVPLKIEDDGRIFPVSDNAQSIINCLLKEVNKNNVDIRLGEGVVKIEKIENGFKVITTANEYWVENLVITTGSSVKSWKNIQTLGHKIVPPVPSLFTFNCKDKRIEGLMGTSFPMVEAEIPALKLKENGPMLITHWGFSGPSVLRLSAWGAENLALEKYQFDLKINFIGLPKTEAIQEIQDYKRDNPKQKVLVNRLFDLTKRFWHQMVGLQGINEDLNYADLSNKKIDAICSALCEAKFVVNGKSIFKEEFVTAGGVELSEINFVEMSSKKVSNLYFAGEVLNIDAITGGFNFQACWSEAFIVSESLKFKHNV